MKTFWLWLVKSSDDPSRYSKTIKGVGVGLVAALTVFNIDTASLSDVFKYLVQFLEAFFVVVSAWMTLTGAVRKVATTFAGTNKVLNQ